MFYPKYGKRFIDLIGSLLLLIVSLPILLITSFFLFAQNKGGVFYYQKRPGFKEKPFYIIKFKTMTDQKDEKGNLLSNSERITTIGRWVRKLSLDELPQLLNVLKGDMSLIGPRPLLMKYLPLYSDEQHQRHEVKPGITGWAQVNGRNSISWEEKFTLDLYYVDNVSFLLDVRIVGLTVLKILKREGINQSDSQTMQPFKGTK
ncbi:sugar transferase [Fodinibius saliphilus]|uniref:sugar transferase n=1 Tax=Fodinibius saliphilus TaxID=1920650 RepID=UPI001109C0B4|nr:sugar transferase [Fodinibius saliphilus]